MYIPIYTIVYSTKQRREVSSCRGNNNWLRKGKTQKAPNMLLCSSNMLFAHQTCYRQIDTVYVQCINALDTLRYGHIFSLGMHLHPNVFSASVFVSQYIQCVDALDLI